MNASELATGTVPAARLGSGTANSATILRGNNTWVSPASLGLIDGSGVADHLSYWTDDHSLASSPLMRIDGDTTEHRGTGGATLFKVSGGSSSGVSTSGASISADPSVVVYGVYKTGLETPIPVRLASVNGGDIQIDNGSVLAEFKTDTFQPHDDDEYSLGASDKRWSEAYIRTLHTDALKDSGGNDALKLDAVASAVNQVTASNAATGDSPVLMATGDDADIDLLLSGKGTGTVILNGVKVYRALLTQSGTSVPTVTVLENSLGGTVVWTRDSIGNYVGTLAGAFPSGKTGVLCGQRPSLDSGGGEGTMYSFGTAQPDANTITLRTSGITVTTLGTSFSTDDGLLDSTFIAIYVNP